jgi:hypothetical protein
MPSGISIRRSVGIDFLLDQLVTEKPLEIFINDRIEAPGMDEGVVLLLHVSLHVVPVTRDVLFPQMGAVRMVDMALCSFHGRERHCLHRCCNGRSARNIKKSCPVKNRDKNQILRYHPCWLKEPTSSCRI